MARSTTSPSASTMRARVARHCSSRYSTSSPRAPTSMRARRRCSTATSSHPTSCTTPMAAASSVTLGRASSCTAAHRRRRSGWGRSSTSRRRSTGRIRTACPPTSSRSASSLRALPHGRDGHQLLRRGRYVRGRRPRRWPRDAARAAAAHAAGVAAAPRRERPLRVRVEPALCSDARDAAARPSFAELADGFSDVRHAEGGKQSEWL